jgi:D-alanyl-D-alanine carboxypeptidase/D-alanyl-D-alanine-endopeptidase (penicillin-binding protein 4)
MLQVSSLQNLARRVVAVLLCVAVAQSAAAAPSIPPPLERQLRLLRVPIDDVSLYVRAATSSAQPVLEVNAQVPRNPASVMKLLTTRAALDRLGPDYTWTTAAYLNGPLQQGRLDGDLILKGSGLSRQARLSAESVGRLLLDTYASP